MTSFWYLWPSPMYMSSRTPMTSAMKETMVAVSRTVSPWAIWDFFSSRSWTVRPSMLQALAKEKRVRVELSRKMEMPRPESKMRGLMLRSRRLRRALATAMTASRSSLDLSQVSRKSFSYMSEKSRVSSLSMSF